MFWVGLILTVAASLAGIPPTRDWVCKWFKINEKVFSTVRYFLVFTGAIIAAVVYVQKSREITKLQHTIDAIREYSAVALLNQHGITGKYRDGLEENPDSRLLGLKEMFIKHEGQWAVKCDEVSIEKAREITTSYPKFPWSYFHLARCLRKKEDPAWKDYAEKGIQIFEYTTSLADHHSLHDVGLKMLREHLNGP